jgi:glycosyltransferase involved in cell wall biosynthesis
LKILIVTSEWPSERHQNRATFLVNQVSSLADQGVEATVFAFRGKANPLRYLAAWWRLRREHRFGDYDIVHAHFGQSGLVAMPCPVPLVVTFHGSDLQGIEREDGRQTLRGRILRLVSRYVARRADKVIVVAKTLEPFLPDDLTASVIPCGIDLEAFHPLPQLEARAELGFDGNEAIVLFVGDPRNPIKNVALAKKAVERLEESLSARLVILHGQPHDRVRTFLSASDVMLVTSHHEGSPTAVKEALACGLPVVSVAVGDVPERLAGIPECRVCHGEDLQEISAHLHEVLGRRRRVSRNQEALEKIEIGAISRRLVELYREVMAGTSGNTAGASAAKQVL